MRHRATRPGRIRSDDGVATVEFALVATFLLIPILTGVIQFGISYSQYQVLQGAAREGARCAAVQATGFSDCDWEVAVENAAVPYTLTTAPVVQVAGLGPGTVCTDDTVGQDVTVSWEQMFDLSLIAMVPLLPKEVPAKISGTFRCE